MTQEHPDIHLDFSRLKETRRGSRQAIEDKAIDAYHRALDEGKGREEAEKQYFETFNNSHGKQKLTSVPNIK